jgi:hypothetical protein
LQGGVEGTGFWTDYGGAATGRLDWHHPFGGSSAFWGLRLEGRYVHPNEGGDRWAVSGGPEIGWRPSDAIDLSLSAGPCAWLTDGTWVGFRTAPTLEEVPDAWVGQAVSVGLWQGVAFEYYGRVPAEFEHFVVAGSLGLFLSSTQ